MMGGHPGAFGGRFAPGRMPPGAMAPGGMPPGAFPMFPPDPRLQRMAPNQGMRMPPPPVGQPFPGAVGMPRPVGPGAPMGEFLPGNTCRKFEKCSIFCNFPRFPG